MTEIGIRALKQNASAVAAQAAAGETMTITDRGRPIAQLTPLHASPMQRLRDAGRVRPPRRRIQDVPGPEPGPAVSVALAESRASDRH